MELFAKTPEPPYYAVIFTSVRTEGENGYPAMARRMMELASEQIGFLGAESARETVGVTVSYWRDLASIQRWRENVEHRIAQFYGKERWYKAFSVRVARVERAYRWEKG